MPDQSVFFAEFHSPVHVYGVPYRHFSMVPTDVAPKSLQSLEWTSDVGLIAKLLINDGEVTIFIPWGNVASARLTL